MEESKQEAIEVRSSDKAPLASARPDKEAKIVQMIQDIKANETQSTQASAATATARDND